MGDEQHARALGQALPVSDFPKGLHARAPVLFGLTVVLGVVPVVEEEQDIGRP